MNEEKRDQSLIFRIEGTEEEVKKMIEEMTAIVTEIAPQATVSIEYTEGK